MHKKASVHTDGGEYFDTMSGTAHANFGLAGMQAGVFAGYGYGDNIDNTDRADMYWYGVEAAKIIGDFALSAQAGLASSDNDHSSLNFEDRVFGAVQARYFMGDNIMVTGDYNFSVGNIHGDDILQTQFGVEGMMQLGQSNFYGLASYRHAHMNADFNGGSEGQGAENTFGIGVTMLFGGGTLRDTFGGSTPMINPTYLPTLGVNTSTYD